MHGGWFGGSHPIFGGWGGYGMGMFGMFFGWLFIAALIGGVVLLVIWAARQAGGSASSASRGPAGAQSAREILDARYARGELTREQYLTALEDLGGKGGAS